MEFSVDSEPESSVESGEAAARRQFSNRSIGVAIGGAVVAAVLLAAVFFGGSDAQPEPINNELAALAFQNVDGSLGSLADYQGQPLVVNFFAAYCAPCRAEMPDFEAVHLANKGDVTFLGVSHDLDEVAWQGFVAETQITYDTVFQPGQELWTELDAIGLPATAFLSPEGDVLQLWSGILSKEKLQELIDGNLVAA